jgi:hypothetical protein
VGELVLTLYLLSRRWDIAAAGLQRPAVQLLLRAWGLQLRLRTSYEGRQAEVARLAEYIRLAHVRPAAWEPDGEEGGEAKYCSAPLLQVLMVRQMSIFHTSRQEALDTTIQEAISDQAAYMEDFGQAKLVNETDANAIEAASQN